MAEAKKVNEQFFVSKINKILAFARLSSFDALPTERRLSLRNLYNCLVISLIKLT